MSPLPDTGRSVVPRSGAAAEREAAPAPRSVEAAGAVRRRAWSTLAARPTLAAALVYAVLSLVFVGQGLLPGRTLSGSDYLWSTVPWASSRPADVPLLGSNFEQADAADVFQPFFDYSKAAFPHPPLWNPHIMAGRPFLADGQSALFSPFTLPAEVLPLSKALGLMALLKFFVAAFGTYLFGRLMGMRFGGALLAGIVFAFGTFFVVWLPWPLTDSFPFLPWLLLTTELVVRRPGPLPATALAAFVALQFFGGHPETSLHLMFATVVFFGLRLTQRWLQEGRERRVLARPALTFGLALAGGTALAAITLLPLIEFLYHSADLAHRRKNDPAHLDSRFIGALFLNDYWGRPTQTPLVPFIGNRALYSGGITLMLGSLALLLRPTATRLGFAAFGAFILAVVMGVEPFATLTRLPGFATTHSGRLVILLLFVLAMLAGWGLDDLTRRVPGRRSRRRQALAAATAIFCVPFVWMLVAGTIDLGRLRPAFDLAWGFSDHRPANPLSPPGDATVATIRLSALLQWLPLAGLGLIVVAIPLLDRPRRLRRLLPVGALVTVAITVLVADLFRTNMGNNPAIPVEHARQPSTGAIHYLQSRRPNRFAGLNGKRGIQPLLPDLAVRYRLYDARGYDYPVERRYDTFWRATAGPAEYFNVVTAEALATPAALRGMSLLSVADLIQDPEDPPSRLPGLKLAYSGRDARVYRNANALPRTFLVDRQQVTQGADAALTAIRNPHFDARNVAVTERPVSGIPQAGRQDGGTAGTARLVHYGSERVVARAEARRRSLLVLTDVHYPGWKATVDGKRADIERVDYLLRGVVVPPGTHDVEFSYRPLSWRLGWLVSLIALVALVAAAAVGWQRRRWEGHRS
jgi:Bacterial membrane protein YfhO